MKRSDLGITVQLADYPVSQIQGRDSCLRDHLSGIKEAAGIITFQSFYNCCNQPAGASPGFTC